MTVSMTTACIYDCTYNYCCIYMTVSTTTACIYDYCIYLYDYTYLETHHSIKVVVELLAELSEAVSVEYYWTRILQRWKNKL